MKPLYQNIKIPACSKTNIAESKDLFQYIDSDFDNYNLQSDSPETKETEFAVLELTEDKTFAQMFTKPEEMCLTQAQIIEYVKNNRDKINNWYSFFLFKENNKFFVAVVRFDDRDQLKVDVYRFSNDYVWYGEDHHRVVVPKLALKHFDSCPSDTLSLPKALIINGVKYIKA